MTVNLHINQLSVCYEDKKILQDVTLLAQAGSLHAIMGPNGSGKSTLALTLMGHPAYTLTSGNIMLTGQDITALPAHKRAQAGLFLSFQQPHEIPGVPIASFLKAAYEATHDQIKPNVLRERACSYMELLQMDPAMYYRNVHEGFSGGEKKKLELLQLLLLKPTVAMLDEIDSGLDVDALKAVAQALHIAQEENPTMSILLITHYKRILDYIEPAYVHIMHNGSLVRSGNYKLASLVEQYGYDGYEKNA